MPWQAFFSPPRRKSPSHVSWGFFNGVITTDALLQFHDYLVYPVHSLCQALKDLAPAEAVGTAIMGHWVMWCVWACWVQFVDAVQLLSVPQFHNRNCTVAFKFRYVLVLILVCLQSRFGSGPDLHFSPRQRSKSSEPTNSSTSCSRRTWAAMFSKQTKQDT